MNANSAKREFRRNAARRNAAANDIAEAVSAGVAPNPESVRAWRLATMRLYAAQRHLRPRECGAALGGRTTDTAHVPAVEVSDGCRAPDNAAPNPAPFPNHNQTRKETMNAQRKEARHV